MRAPSFWGCYGTNFPGADGTAIGTGYQNTIDVETACTEPAIAADWCANLTLGGYRDWFLPSLDELIQLLTNLNISGSYWSSTEAGSQKFHAYSVSGNTCISTGKSNNRSVRPIRDF